MAGTGDMVVTAVMEHMEAMVMAIPRGTMKMSQQQKEQVWLVF